MRKLLVGMAVALIMVSAAMADPDQVQIGFNGSSYGPYQTGSGGEFTFTVYSPPGWLDLSGYAAGITKDIFPGPSGTFETFCLEGNEVIYGYAAVYNAVINQNAVLGGMSGGNGTSGDPVSVGTGWLYQQFATGNWLSGLSYNYGANRTTSADLLQQAIWWLEGEKNVVYNPANMYMAAVVAQFGSQAAAMADGGWNYGVYALNLTDPANGANAQDSLYYRVPDGGATVLLLGLAFAVLSLVSRRIRG